MPYDASLFRLIVMCSPRAQTEAQLFERFNRTPCCGVGPDPAFRSALPLALTDMVYKGWLACDEGKYVATRHAFERGVDVTALHQMTVREYIELPRNDAAES